MAQGDTSGRGRRYYLKDHLGSIRAVVGGSETVTRDYYPFGLRMADRHMLADSVQTRKDYTGYEKDAARGCTVRGHAVRSSARAG